MTQEIKPCPFCGNFPRKAYVDTLCCNNKTCPIFDYPFKTSDWNTRAEPAPLPDEAYDISSKFSKRNAGELIAYCNDILAGKNELMPGTLRAHIAALTSERDLWQTENNLAQRGIALHLERIAALEADNKRLRDLLECWDGVSTSHEPTGHNENCGCLRCNTQEALAQPDPQKCGTCGGTGGKWTGDRSFDACPDCNGTGKAGV